MSVIKTVLSGRNTMKRGVSDVGGGRYGRKPYTTRKSNALSYECRDCHKIRFVTRLELSRAARPRCLGCGGTLIETDATADATMSEQLANNAKLLKEEAPDPSGACRCIYCDQAWRRHYYLAKHLASSPECRKKQKEAEKMVEIKGRVFFKGTISLFEQPGKRKSKKWLVVGLLETGEFAEVNVYSRLQDAEDFIEPHVISLYASRIIQAWMNAKEDDQEDVRCSHCRAKFVQGVFGDANYYLVLHLVHNKLCLAKCDNDNLLHQVKEKKRQLDLL